MTTVSDDFNRANGALGTNWADGVDSSALGISGNQVVGTNDGLDHVALWAGTGLSQNQTSTIRLGALSPGTLFGRVVVRGSGSGTGFNGYGAYTDGATGGGAGSTEIEVWSAGVTSAIGNVATTFGSGDVLGLSVTGTGTAVSLQMWKNGTAVGTAIAPATAYNSGQPGFGGYNASTLDDFSATDGTGGGGGSSFKAYFAMGANQAIY